MSTHLGHVIETTERYTAWLTEGITGKLEESNSAEVDASSICTVVGEQLTRKSTIKKDRSDKKESRKAPDSDEEFAVCFYLFNMT